MIRIRAPRPLPFIGSSRPRAWMWGGLIVVLLGGCAVGSPVSRLARAAPAPSREVLPNGLKLIVQERHAGEVVALELWIGAGARDEGPDERGFSHLLEHMLFQGAGPRERGRLEEEVEGAGGRINAGTSYDYAFYYILLPAPRAAAGIGMLADMAFAAHLDADEIARERDVVFEEGRRAEDNPRTLLNRRLYELVFPGHPYGLPLLGDPAVLRRATQATLRAYYARHYVPDNISLVVVGPVDPREIRAAVDRSFGVAARAGYVRPAASAPRPLAGDSRIEVPRRERQASLGLGWRAPGVGQADMYPVDLLALILGGSRSSRLNQALRERAQLVASVAASYSALVDSGVFTITAQFEPADESRVRAGILDEVRRVQEEGVSTEELALAVTATESRYEFSRETAEGLALALGRAETLWSLEGERHYLDRIRAVTREEVRQAARHYLAAPHATVALAPEREGS